MGRWARIWLTVYVAVAAVDLIAETAHLFWVALAALIAGAARAGRGAGDLRASGSAAALGAGRPVLRLARRLARRSAGAAHRLEDRVLLPRPRLLHRRVLAVPVAQRARPARVCWPATPSASRPCWPGWCRPPAGSTDRPWSRTGSRWAWWRCSPPASGPTATVGGIVFIVSDMSIAVTSFVYPGQARARRAVDHEHLPGGPAAAGARCDRRTRPPTARRLVDARADGRPRSTARPTRSR